MFRDQPQRQPQPQSRPYILFRRVEGFKYFFDPLRRNAGSVVEECYSDAGGSRQVSSSMNLFGPDSKASLFRHRFDRVRQQIGENLAYFTGKALDYNPVAIFGLETNPL